jgi:lipopolysaccharide export system permease protein
LQWFATHGADALDVLRFYAARVWLLASRVVPMSLLVATALTASLLAAQGELMGMRACGISAPRALLPVLVISAIAVPVYFLYNDEVVPRANALADEVKTREIKNEGPDRPFEAVWYRIGRHLYEADQLDLGMGNAREIRIYEMGEDGLPVSRADARSARHVGHGVWRLFDPVRVEISGEHLRRVPAAPFAELGDALPANVDTMHLDVAALAAEIREVEQSGYDATAYRVDLQSKLAAPLACLILPALALFYSVTGPPFPAPVRTLLVSALVALAWVLLNGVGVSLGYGGVVRPSVGGWGAPAAFAAAAIWLVVRMRRHGQSF